MEKKKTIIQRIFARVKIIIDAIKAASMLQKIIMMVAALFAGASAYNEFGSAPDEVVPLPIPEEFIVSGAMEHNHELKKHAHEAKSITLIEINSAIQDAIKENNSARDAKHH